jgi:cohesin complex subunit SA-1/2
LLSEVYSLPTRKNDFSLLVKNLCLAYLASTDEEVLIQIASSLATLVQGKHARVADVKSHIKRSFSAQQDRLMELFFESDPESSSAEERKKAPTTRGSRRSDSTATTGSVSETVFSNVNETEIEYSICLCLLRLKFLLKQLPLSLLFDEVDDGEENEVEGFFRTVSEALGKRLVDRKPVIDEDDADTSRSTTIASVWKSADLATHREVAKAVDIGLDVLLSIVAWKVRYFEKEIIDNAKVGVVDDEEVSDHIVIRLRDGLAKLVGLCFEQFLEEQPGLVYSMEQEDFSADVQASAGRVASDLRTLFPREWSSARNPTLRSFALLDDAHLIGGFVRYLNSREDEFVDEASVEDVRHTKELVLPIARSLTANWTDGNRREAGIVLSHLAGKGKMTRQTVHVLARMLKKVRLEAVSQEHPADPPTYAWKPFLSRSILFASWSHKWQLSVWRFKSGSMANQRNLIVTTRQKSRCTSLKQPKRPTPCW